MGGTATSAGAAGGGAKRNNRSPRPHATAAGAPLARKATSAPSRVARCSSSGRGTESPTRARSEEHTSELQSRLQFVCRLLLGKKKLKPLDVLISSAPCHNVSLPNTIANANLT